MARRTPPLGWLQLRHRPLRLLVAAADTALRLSRFFAMSDRFWLNLQMRFELESEKDRLGALLESEVEVFAKAG